MAELRYQLDCLEAVEAGAELLKFMARKPAKEPHAKSVRADASSLHWSPGNRHELFTHARLGVPDAIREAHGNSLSAKDVASCFTVNCTRKGEVCFRAPSAEDAKRWATGIVLLAAGINKQSLYNRKSAARVAGLPSRSDVPRKRRRFGVSAVGAADASKKQRASGSTSPRAPTPEVRRASQPPPIFASSLSIVRTHARKHTHRTACPCRLLDAGATLCQTLERCQRMTRRCS